MAIFGVLIGVRSASVFWGVLRVALVGTVSVAPVSIIANLGSINGWETRVIRCKKQTLTTHINLVKKFAAIRMIQSRNWQWKALRGKGCHLEELIETGWENPKRSPILVGRGDFAVAWCRMEMHPSEINELTISFLQVLNCAP